MDIRDMGLDDLKQEVVRREARLKELEEEMGIEERKEAIAEWSPKRLNEYTIDDKVAAFESFYLSAKRDWDDAVKGIVRDDDADHYAWESIMELLGVDVWTHYNKLNK